MNRTLRLIAVAACLAFAGTESLPGQTPSVAIEQQLRSQYRITIVGNNGVVTQAGSVAVIQKDGIMALPSPAEWPCNSYKPSGQIKQSGLCAFNYVQARPNTRLFQVGEKVYLVAIQAKPTEIVFRVQTPVETADGIPFKAAVSFQFQKGYLDSMKLKELQDAISQIFALDVSSPGQESTQAQPKSPVAPVVSLRLPSTYVSAKTPTDQLQLNADNSFSLQESGQSYHGTFVVSGNTLELSINETGIKTTGSLQGNSLTDSSGQTWVLREGPVQAAPSVDILQNKDVIKMAKAGFDDAIIITKIGSSSCQFDTSPDALIQLKQAGVDATVLKAMLGARK